MSMNRRVVRLERYRNQRQGAHVARRRDEATDGPLPAVFGRYDAAVEAYRAALQEARGANPGASHVPETPELTAAHGEMLRARGELRVFARGRGDS